MLVAWDMGDCRGNLGTARPDSCQEAREVACDAGPGRAGLWRAVRDRLREDADGAGVELSRARGAAGVALPRGSPESALLELCGIGQVGGVEARRDDESPPCLPIGGLAGLVNGQEEQDATLVKPEVPRRVCVRHDDLFYESSLDIVVVASYALILAPRHQPLPCGPVVGDGRPGAAFVNQVASRLRGKRIQIAHHDFPSMLATATSPAWRPSSRYAKLAGALDLPGRALLPGLRITYDLAFDRKCEASHLRSTSAVHFSQSFTRHRHLPLRHRRWRASRPRPSPAAAPP